MKNHSPAPIVSRENDAGKPKLYGHGLTSVKLIKLINGNIIGLR